MRTTPAALLWYLVFLVLIATALFSLGPLHMPLLPVAIAATMVMVIVAAIGAARARRSARSNVPVVLAGLAAALTLTAVMLLFDWAAGAGDVNLTVRSFIAYLRLPVTRGDGVFFALPLVVVFLATALGVLIGNLVGQNAAK